MSAGTKAGAYAQMIKGKLEELTGKATNNTRLTNKGRKDMVAGKAREVGQNAKQKFRK
ncbi:hypothetical protein CLV63_10827 [Murinocardiopsis flavida]|uniref:CsbD-like protein n=1 Tax=Murinocardiopsis flavida TaxID=645275 RepID=A0A2P8DJF2_9ACTN|nr:CsbD family protein [Murinocardiopsis flavida]PSK97309.1 hypothetical protein CLV63_10827 [Murinocardiopsis flavida]